MFSVCIPGEVISVGILLIKQKNIIILWIFLETFLKDTPIYGEAE